MTTLTLRTVLGWWREDIRLWRRVNGPIPIGTDVLEQALGKEGRMVRFSFRGQNMGRPTYTVWARRGQFVIGRIEWRNQWGAYAFVPDAQHQIETPLNREILGEIWAMLKELKS